MAIIPGAVVPLVADTGELGVGVCTIDITLLAHPTDDVVATPADTGVAIPSCIHTLPSAKAS